MGKTLFELLTPITYWLLIAMWSFILYFYLKRLRTDWHQGNIMLILLIILAIDAFRTLFESFYFGAWYTAHVGLLPISIHDFLVQPQMVIVPKLLNVFAAGLIITILFRYWLPREGETIRLLETTVNKRTSELSKTIERLESEIIHRKRTEGKLKESEAKYMDLYENAPDMYASINAKTALVKECNRTLANTLGYSKEEIIGRSVFDLYHPDCLEEVKETFKLFVGTGAVRNKELQLQRKDGSILDVSLNASAIRGEDGQILISRSTLRDITERKRAEEAYLISVSRSEDVFNKATIPLCFIDKEKTILNFNTQFEKTFGYSQEEIPTLNEWWQMAYPDPIYRKWVIDTCSEALQQAVNAKTDIEPIEYSVTCKNGDSRKMVVFGSFIEHELLLTFFDITERKEVEEELEKHREHLEELVRERTAELEEARNTAQQYLDIAGVILVAIDTDRRVTLINQKGCEILGGSAGEITGKDWFETFVPENIRQDVIQAFHRLMSGESESEEYFENPVLTKSGEERLIAWHNALLRDDQGKIVGSLSSGEDVTEQKCAEDQIRRLNQNLQDRAVALETANKELAAFAYSVSHDLRTPLRHIEGFMELLQKRTTPDLDERSRHYMDTISDSAKRMGTLIDDLLSFSRMVRQQISKKDVDLSKLTQEIIREFEPESANRDIHWRVDDLPVVTGDRTMLRMVLVNLISNALKFTRPVQQAEIEIGSMPDTKTETIIFVRDNGVGFDMNYVDKLFGVFQRLHRVDEFEGTGIGLANVRRIIARHGGRTWAEGKIDQGATFYFSLPLT